MKTSKSVALDSSGSRRSQPPRTTRNNPPRSTISGARNFAPRGSTSSGLEEAPIQIFPAITHFADAIAALPKELVRHFTLLKEVDAKIFLPEEDLTRLVNDALNAPLPQQIQPVGVQNCLDLSSASMSIQGSFNGSAMKYHAGSMMPVPKADAVWDSANVPRRQLFNRCAHTMQSMLTSLDEKNHVISTAGEALAKQIARIDDCFPHIEYEISEEARNGSRTHWAYAENRHPRTNASTSSRKETAANQLSAAAQQLADDVAARSDARKQALLEKKRGRNQHVDPDFEDQQDIKQKDKKLHGNSKVRRVLDAPAAVGIGITNGSTTNGNQPKRRKIEKIMAGNTVIERPISSVASANGTAAKGKPGSPQETPQPEGPKKRIRAAPAVSNGNTSRKRNNTVTSAARSPILASSPIRATFSEPKPFGKQSPPPTNGSGRPPSVKGRRNSMQSNLEKRPPSIASTGHNYTAISDSNVTSAIQTRPVPEVKNLGTEPNTEAQGEPKADESKKNEVEIIAGAVLGNKRDISARRELPETNGDTVHTIQTATVTTTKSGRASKPSTLSIPSFPDPVRSRPSRNSSELTSSGKRSHKKGLGATAQLLADQNLGAEDVDKNEEEEEEDVEIDANEPRYCYCNNVSYGEMVGCDADGCKREWFHLACVGLKTAPKSNAKWYCDDCKKGKRSSSGR